MWFDSSIALIFAPFLPLLPKHYQLDETQLVHQLAEFMEVDPLRIQHLMASEAPNENSQSHPVKQLQTNLMSTIKLI
jgi:hypothetical protein